MNRFFKVLSVMVLTVFLAGSLLAQEGAVDKGVILLGGGLSFSSSGGDFYENADGDRMTEVSLSPKFGYFVIPSLAVGVMVDFNMVKQGDYDPTTWGVGPFVSYYIDLDQEGGKGSVYPFVGASYTYGKWKFGDDEATQHNIKFGGGVNYMLTNTVGLYGMGSYNIVKYKADGADETIDGNSFGGEAGFQIFFY